MSHDTARSHGNLPGMSSKLWAKQIPWSSLWLTHANAIELGLRRQTDSSALPDHAKSLQTGKNVETVCVLEASWSQQIKHNNPVQNEAGECRILYLLS